ncbi:MAG: ribosomal L7Ae/L30e/S12e/Gadd45 family protein [Candidatus Thermoplasmatota archaeon]|nr:ribosomal L7Ae/L30e/S12e/Gadd45 family protein [Candidatus Thermoplasmatota archaeon]
MNTEESVRLLVRTGSYVMGEKEVRELIKAQEAKLVIFSKRFDEELLSMCEKNRIPSIKLARTSMELGVICGKPFPVSVIGVKEEGDSGILAFRGANG